MLEILQDNNNVGNKCKCESFLANTRDLAYMGKSSIIVKTSSILDVGRGPGFASDLLY